MSTLETAFAWKYAIENNSGPTCLILSRQNCDFQKRNGEQIALINKGAYILKDSKNKRRVLLLASGSEVKIALKSQEKLESQGDNKELYEAEKEHNTAYLIEKWSICGVKPPRFGI
mgnify:CR=1 FL=1